MLIIHLVPKPAAPTPAGSANASSAHRSSYLAQSRQYGFMLWGWANLKPALSSLGADCSIAFAV